MHSLEWSLSQQSFKWKKRVFERETGFSKAIDMNDLPTFISVPSECQSQPKKDRNKPTAKQNNKISDDFRFLG